MVDAHPAPREANAQRRLLHAADIEEMLARMTTEVMRHYATDCTGPLGVTSGSLALVGIRTGGAHLAERLAERLATRLGVRPPVGALDITLYRDDVLLAQNPAPLVRGTEIPFDVADRYVVLVDDVLLTGRTVRAALDALLDLGRPRCVRLAVLLDRGLRELPVAADVVGRVLETHPDERVEVLLSEAGAAVDEVVCLPLLSSSVEAGPSRGGSP